MRVDEKQALSLSQAVWESALGLGIAVDPKGSTQPIAEQVYASRIMVSGAWQGAIVIECPESIGRHAAAMFYSSDGESASFEEIRDALRELTERVGRKMTALLPEETRLSRPTVNAAESAELPEGLRDLSELRLSCEGRAVRIAFFEGEPQLAGVR
jgi:hypothetical protein